MKQNDTRTHKTICIDPAKFKDRLQEDDTGEHIFSDEHILRFIVDQLNDAGLEIARFYHDCEYGIEYLGTRHYVGQHIEDDPERAVVAAMEELSNELNSRNDTECWCTYQHGEHCLHIKESTTAESEEEPET